MFQLGFAGLEIAQWSLVVEVDPTMPQVPLMDTLEPELILKSDQQLIDTGLFGGLDIDGGSASQEMLFQLDFEILFAFHCELSAKQTTNKTLETIHYSDGGLFYALSYFADHLAGNLDNLPAPLFDKRAHCLSC